MRFIAYFKNLSSTKLFALILVFLAVIILVIQPLGWVIGYIQSQKNLLTNPSFELEDTSWLIEGTPPGSEQWEFDKSTKFSGNRSVKLYLDPSAQWLSGTGVKQQFPVLAKRQYKLVAKFKYQSFEGENANAVALLVKQFGANGQIIRNPNPAFLDPDYSVFERFQPDSGAWFEEEISFDVDEATEAIEITVGLFGPSPGTLWVDDVNLKVDFSTSSQSTFPLAVLVLFLLGSAYSLNSFFEPGAGSGWAICLKKKEKAIYRFFFAAQIGLILLFIYTIPPVKNWSARYALPTISNWYDKAEAYLLGTKTLEAIVAEMSPVNFSDSYQTELPVYDLHLTPKSIMQLEGILQTLRKQQVLLAKDQIWLDADFAYLNNVSPVQVRLRGDLPPHWLGSTKSWRVKFRPDQLFNSKREINLIIPSDKAYVSDYTFNHVARSQGLLTLRDQFVILKINGQRASLYYEVEHFENELLVANNKPEGHIFTTSDTWVQTTLNGFGTASGRYYENDTDRTTAKMRSYTEIYPENSTSVATLNQLINILYNNPDSVTPEQLEPLIDMEKYLKYNALRMVFGSFHSNWGNNLKLYFDPTTGRFEPIPWDVHNYSLSLENHTFEKRVAGGGPLDRAVLRNNLYQFQRNKYLWHFLRSDFAAMLAFYDKTFETIKVYLDDKAHDKIVSYYKQNLMTNAALLRGILSFSRAFAIIESPTYQDGVAETQPHYYRVELLNDSFSPLRLQAISFTNEQHSNSGYKLYLDANENGTLDEDDQLLDHVQTSQQQDIYQIANINQIIYSDRDEDLVPIPRPYNFFLVLDNVDSPPLLADFEFDLQNAVTGEIVSSDYIFAQTMYQHFYTNYAAIYQSREDFLNATPIFQLGQASLSENAVVLPSGTYTLEENLIIPKGMEVYIEPGVQIFSESDVSIVSYSPIVAIGTEESPILFGAIDDTQGWGVLGLTLVEEESRFEHVHFNRTGEAQINGIYFSGGLAAHNSDVYISNSQFAHAASEDALNVKNAQVTIEDSLFQDNASDAIDLDWAEKGIVIGNTFEDNAGDGIDLSGTGIPIVNNRIHDSGDKGISVGEMSSPLIFNNFLTGNQIGIAVKDLSDARILSNTVLDSNTGLAIYQKKPEFGGGRALLRNTLIWDAQTAIQLDENSALQVDSSNNIQGGYLTSRIIEPIFNTADDTYMLDIKNPPELLYEAKLSIIEELTNIKLTVGPIGVIPSIYKAPTSTIKNILKQD